MATNLDYNINVNSSNGIQALNNLQNKVSGLTASFGKLNTALSGLAIGAAVVNAVRFADAIKDLSDSTGIAVANVLGFGKALQEFGGNSEVAEKGILRLVSNIGAAAEGSSELQSAFGRVGVSLNDLATLSEQDILAKVVSGLGNITDKSEQAYLKQQLLGKEFRNVAVNGQALSQAYATATASAQANAEAITRASDAYDKFEKSIGAFKLGILSAISPLTDFIAGLDAKRVEEFAEAIGRIVIVIASALLYFKGIALAATAFAALGLTAGSAAAAVAAFSLALGAALAKLMLIIAVIGAINAVIKFAFGIDPIKELINWTSKAYKSVKEFLGIKSEDTSQGTKKNTDAAKENAKATEAAGAAARKVVDPFKTLREQISGLADEYARVNRANIDGINLNTDLIGKSREESEVRKAVAELAKREGDEIRKLTDQKAKLTKEQQQAGLGKEIDAQIAKIREQTKVDIEATESAIRNSEARANARKLEEFAVNSQINVERDLRKIQDDINKSTLSEMERRQYDILAAARERARAEIEAEQIRRGSLLTDQEKLKYYQAAVKGTEELIKKETESYNKSRTFSAGWKRAFQEYTDNATNAARAAERIFQKATQGMEDLIVGFAKTGKFEWKSFVSNMLEELLRSQIQQTFANIMKAMSGSMGGSGSGGGILDMVFGGLSSLLGGGESAGKDPSNPLYVMDVSGGMGGGGGITGVSGEESSGGIFSGITGMFGKAWEGVKSVGSSILGGIGSTIGGVVDTISKVGSTIGSIFSGTAGKYGTNVGSQQSRMLYEQDQGMGDGILDTISNGIGNFFGGFFANGGVLGAGKFGIAGENGPELISGPAGISPMGGGTNVVYNINAVDALSFKQLLAQDPAFLYGVTMQGAKGIPGRR